MPIPLAYLDAGSGSLLVSAIAAGTAGVGVAARVGWRRLKRTVGRRGVSEPGPATPPVGPVEARQEAPAAE